MVADLRALIDASEAATLAHKQACEATAGDDSAEACELRERLYMERCEAANLLVVAIMLARGQRIAW